MEAEGIGMGWQRIKRPRKRGRTRPYPSQGPAGGALPRRERGAERFFPLMLLLLLIPPLPPPPLGKTAQGPRVEERYAAPGQDRDPRLGSADVGAAARGRDRARGNDDEEDAGEREGTRRSESSASVPGSGNRYLEGGLGEDCT